MNTKIEIRDRSWKSLRGSGPSEKVIPFAASVAALAAAILLLPSAAWAGGVVTTCTEAALRAAMAGGGTVTFACDGTITLSSTIGIATNTVLDGTGHRVTISGGNTVQVLFVNPNVTLSLINLTIANGFIWGTDGGPGYPGG